VVRRRKERGGFSKGKCIMCPRRSRTCRREEGEKFGKNLLAEKRLSDSCFAILVETFEAVGEEQASASSIYMSLHFMQEAENQNMRRTWRNQVFYTYFPGQLPPIKP
jgi:hypothetical protein